LTKQLLFAKFIVLFEYFRSPGRGYVNLVEVVVRDNNVDQALRALKKKMQREGLFREMKMRRHYEKPSEARVRESAEAQRRARKLARKNYDRND
jgi:small subunit ribosomal protein S21